MCHPLLLCARDSGERGQLPVLMGLTAMRETRGEVVYLVTEDSERDWEKTLKVRTQSKERTWGEGKRTLTSEAARVSHGTGWQRGSGLK